MITQLLLYMPVIHAGYERLIDAHPEADEILLLDESFAEDFPVLRKEIRAVPAGNAATYLRSRYRRPNIRTVSRESLETVVTADVLVLADDDIGRQLAEKYNLAFGRELLFERVFLRWDRDWSKLGVPPGYTGRVSREQLERYLMGEAIVQSSFSSDWWRQVGALIVRNGEILVAGYNRHVPTEQAPYFNGDPRNSFSRGVEIELGTVIHAEASVIGTAAKLGIALLGCDIFVSTFPCPSCSYLIAEAGIASCVFAGGYAVLDGDRVLKQAGVELLLVDLT